MRTTKLFCKRGHEIAVVGRNTQGHCRQCHKDTTKIYREANREYYAKVSKDWARNNPKRYQERYKNKNWKKYGILNSIGAPFTMVDYLELKEVQKNCCAICNKNEKEFLTQLSVDHDHKTGRVRGLLCYTCNTFLVSVLDNYFYLLDKALNYLNLK